MSEHGYEHILYEVEEGVAKLTFNLPRYANAMDFQGVQETFDALMRAEDDGEVGAVLITGAGKAFCAGFNLKEIPDVEDGLEPHRHALPSPGPLVAPGLSPDRPHAEARPVGGQRPGGRRGAWNIALLRHGGRRRKRIVLVRLAFHRARQ